jgi:2-polyprenyl-6-methoxyphenol hydroxylase-like FAD-dependent oxidoreductase
MTASQPLNVLIVGGGVGGLSAAITLRRIGAEVDFIDIDPNWGALGAGITITGPSLRALRELGVLDEFMAQAYTGEGIRVCDTQGRTLKLLDTPMPAEAGVPGSGGIARPVLHGLLHRKLIEGGTQMRLGLTVEALKAVGDRVEVTFSDGSQGVYDLVLEIGRAHV